MGKFSGQGLIRERLKAAQGHVRGERECSSLKKVRVMFMLIWGAMMRVKAQLVAKISEIIKSRQWMQQQAGGYAVLEED